MVATSDAKAALGISGHENRNPNDGSLTRFGWKVQNKSLTIFARDAYNVEQGVTNDLFQNERNSTPGGLYYATPEDHVDANGGVRTGRVRRSAISSTSPSSCGSCVNENLDNPRKRRARSEVHEFERFSQGKIKRRGKSTK